jgi:hypothetical protein
MVVVESIPKKAGEDPATIELGKTNDAIYWCKGRPVLAQHFRKHVRFERLRWHHYKSIMM